MTFIRLKKITKVLKLQRELMKALSELSDDEWQHYLEHY